MRPQPPRVGDGRLPRPTFHVGHGTRSFRRLMVSILGRVAAAQPPHGGGSGICEPRAWGLVLGSRALLRGRRPPPHSCPQPLHPSPPRPGEGARDEEAEGKGDRERIWKEGRPRWGTPTAFSSLWRSSSPAPVPCEEGRGPICPGRSRRAIRTVWRGSATPRTAPDPRWGTGLAAAVAQGVECER